MSKLFCMNQDQIQQVLEKPFVSEKALETFLFNNHEILEDDICIFGHQLRSGNKDNILDMIGVDRNSNICVFELKNVCAEEEIILQVLRYADWVNKNPDSIKNLWNECKEKPDDFEIDWNNYNIRIILVAPEFKETVFDLSYGLKYKVDFYKISKHETNKENFIIVNHVDTKIKKNHIATVKEDYNWDYYKEQYGEENTNHAKKIIEELEKYCNSQNWDLPCFFNKTYITFQRKNFNIFAVSWERENKLSLRIRIQADHAKSFNSKNWQYYYYDKYYKDAFFFPINRENLSIDELKDLLNQAHEFKTRR